LTRDLLFSVAYHPVISINVSHPYPADLWSIHCVHRFQSRTGRHFINRGWMCRRHATSGRMVIACGRMVIARGRMC
jgi:hypothetical protein